MRKRILFMDNYADFLDIHASVLELEGYQVLKAYSIEQARALLNSQSIHLAIFDIRMVDEDDGKDISGLLLAQEKEYSRLPKIILTAHPDNYDYVRQALVAPDGGTQPAVNFLDKMEGPQVLVDAVGRAFEQHVRTNWNLDIMSDERSPVTFPQLVGAFAPDTPPDLLMERADELEGLFRALFFGEDAIRIERVLWQRGGRVAVTVFSFAKDREPESHVVVCGPCALIAKEAGLYRGFAPTTHASTVLVKSHETVHFGANSYALADTDVDRVSALGALWRSGPEKSFNAALQTLFEMTLVEWSKGRRVPEERRTLDQVFRGQLGLTQERGAGAEHVRERARAVFRWIPTLGYKVELEGAKPTFVFGGRSFTYADPTFYADRATRFGQPILLTYAPGTLTGENILADVNGHTWLTDFADAGLTPLLWNYVSLEAAIRFDWIEPCELIWLHEMERCLLGNDFLRLNVNDVEQPLRKSVRAVRAIRQLASKITGKDVLPYHLGVLLHALRRVADINPTHPHKRSEVSRYAHILMSAAMLSHHLKETGTRTLERGIRIDKENRTVWVNGEKVPMRGRAYELLLGLYENANRLCTRLKIVEEFLKEPYEENDTSQVNRLNTAISRLRDRIEEDPNHPRFIITEPGGYRLATSAED